MNLTRSAPATGTAALAGYPQWYADGKEKGVSASTPAIDAVWTRLKSLQGQRFETKRGLAFTYRISGEVFYPSRTAYHISKTDFGKALALVPLDGPGVINKAVRGPAYVWAVLHDRRVRGNDW